MIDYLMIGEVLKPQGVRGEVMRNALEGAGTVTSALIPWNTCGVFILGTLNIGVAEYAPFAIFNWLMPLMTIVMAFMGLTVADADGVRLSKKRKLQKKANVDA